MPRHTVGLDDSFVNYFGDLDPVIQDQIRVVWAGLEADPFFRPPEDMYVTETQINASDECDYIVCQHINGWLGWSLAWFWEYFDVAPSTPECVVLMLEHQSPPSRIEPKLPN
jgi:hypothetical protein